MNGHATHLENPDDADSPMWSKRAHCRDASESETLGTGRLKSGEEAFMICIPDLPGSEVVFHVSSKATFARQNVCSLIKCAHGLATISGVAAMRRKDLWLNT